MKLFLVLLCTVTYHYCYGYPVVGGESTEEVQIGDWDDTFLKNMLDTRNDIYSKDYFNQLLSNTQEMESLFNDINHQDLDTNEIPNPDSELESLANNINQQDIDKNEIPNPDSELESLANNINQQDIDKNEIPNLDSELGNIEDNDVVFVHIKYDVDSGTIAIDSIAVEDAPEVTAWDRWLWFFLALGAALLMKLVWYLCRKEQQYKRNNEWRIQLVSEK